MLTTPADVAKPPVALLIAGSGSTDHDGNGPQLKPATLKKLSEQLVARGIATLRYDKRGAGGWKKEFGRPEDFRFKDFVDDAASLIAYLRGSDKFSRIALVGHSEGGLVALLATQRAPIDRLVLLATAARKQGDLLKAQLQKQLPAEQYEPIAKAIDNIMAGQIVDPPPAELAIAPSMQPGTRIRPSPKTRSIRCGRSPGPTLIVARRPRPSARRGSISSRSPSPTSRPSHCGCRT